MIRFGFSTPKTRIPVVDGIFYSADPEELTRQIEGYCKGISTPRGSAPVVIIPHAAYSYVGAFLARAITALAERPCDRIVLLSTVHREKDSAIYLPESLHFQTPLGLIKVDEEGVEQLFGCSNLMKIYDVPHLEEHAQEGVLPFLQYFFPRASIVPILLGDNCLPLSRALGNALKVVFSRDLDRTAFIVSTNLSPLCSPKEALASADYFRRLLDSGSPESLLQADRACGAGAIASLLYAFPLDFTPLDREDPSDEEEPLIYYGAFKGEFR